MTTSDDQAEAKAARLNLRLTPRAAERIKLAAELTGQDVTSFVVDAALARAREVLAQEVAIALSPMDARDLVNALDREPRVVPQLAELLRRHGSSASTPAAEAVST